MRSSRATSHGVIGSLATPFSLDGNPFSIIIVPKANITARLISAPQDSGLLVNMTMYEDDSASDYPVIFNTESIALIYEISANAIDLATYNVYWFSGI